MFLMSCCCVVCVGVLMLFVAEGLPRPLGPQPELGLPAVDAFSRFAIGMRLWMISTGALRRVICSRGSIKIIGDGARWHCIA